jgi:flagellar biosynthesis/type III secretory pathway protein FliH
MASVLKGRVVPGVVLDASAEAERLVLNAQQEAAESLRQAAAQCDTIREEARREGDIQGRAECAALLLEAAAARDTLLQDAEGSLVDLALAATTRLVGDVLKDHPDVVRTRVQEVLAKARRAQRVTVYVHEADVGRVQGLEGVVVQASKELAPGDCIVDTDVGQFDARVSTQIDALRAALKKE